MSVKTLGNWLDVARAGQPLSSPNRKPVDEVESELARLRAENATLKMEREILRKSDGVLRQGVQVRYAFVARERTHFPVRVLCRVLTVSVSGLHDYLHRQQRPDPDAALRACGHAVGHKRVRRLMGEEGQHGKVKGGFKPATTDSRHTRPVAGNLLDRQFAVDSPVPAWAGDITYIPTRQGWLYLAIVISLQTRQVLGYSLSDRMPDDLVQQAFLNAWAASPATADTLFHSDRGSQYASRDFLQTITSHGLVPSMSRKGNCWDNAVAESFFATLKNEEATGVYETPAQANIAIASYIHGFYNPTRLHSALGYLSPNDYARTLKQAA